ncbi:hypothetical protein C8Q80DRAFT_456840 [Daedaleopsis nitida]|nr:hypothetical protein C8Q80DRAFT_456840 [Daedaleopsis nitida]
MADSIPKSNVSTALPTLPRDGSTEIPAAALRVSRQCALEGSPSWWGDFYHALQALSVPVSFNLDLQPSPELVNHLLEKLTTSLETHLQSAASSSVRLMHFKSVFLSPQRHASPHNLQLRQLLNMPSFLCLRKKNRKALMKLFASEHPYAVQVLRYGPSPVRREWRICRFCRKHGIIEDEIHINFHCDDVSLRTQRLHMWEDMGATHLQLRDIRWKLRNEPQVLNYIMRHTTLINIFARFLLFTFERCEEQPPLRITSETQLAELHSP